MIILRLFFITLLFLTEPLWADQEPAITTDVLDNGLTVLYQHMPSSEVASIYAYVKTGSATEGRFLGTGISHFVEHMLFKGTDRRDVGVIPSEVKSLGGHINASTSLDYTVYTLDLPAISIDQGIDIISDMIMNSKFDPQQVIKESEVIRGELRLIRDRPDNRLSEMVFDAVFTVHPYKHPPIGYPELFDAITREDLWEYYKTQYVPRNVIISIASPLEPRRVLPVVRKSFQSFKPAPLPLRNLPVESPINSPRVKEDYYATPLYRFSLSFLSVDIHHPDLFALDVLAMALGGMETSRLNQKLFKDMRLVEGISTQNFTPLDKGVFEIQGVTKTDNIDAIEREVWKIIDGIKKNGLMPKELQQIKRSVLSQYVFGRQTTAALALSAATDYALTGDVRFSKAYTTGISQVTNEDVMRVAKAYLKTQGLVKTVLKPKDTNVTQQESKSVATKDNIKKLVLDNGLTIILGEDHSVGVVAVNVVMGAGTRVEDDHNNGISYLTAQLLCKESIQMSERMLNETVESMGALLGCLSGRNSMALRFDSLTTDINEGLNIVAMLIQNPAFKPKAIEEEKKNMLTLLQQREDDIHQQTYLKVLNTLFKKHPFRMDLLGTDETLKNVSRDDIIAFYQRYRVAKNMVISVFGNFDSNQVIAVLRSKFGELRADAVDYPNHLEFPPEQIRREMLEMPKVQSEVAYALQAPPIQSEDRYPMEIIRNVLGSSLSGRLFVKIREALGNAYTLGAMYTPGTDTGLLMAYALVAPNQKEAVAKIIENEIEQIRLNGITEQELKSAKAAIKGDFLMGLTTPSGLSSLTAFNELLGLGYDDHTKYPSRIDAVTVEDVKRVAGQYLDLNHGVLVITQPKKNVE